MPTVEEARLLRLTALACLAGSSGWNFHEVSRVSSSLCRMVKDEPNELLRYQEDIVRTLNIMLHRQEIGRPVSFRTADRWAWRARRQAERTHKGLQVV